MTSIGRLQVTLAWTGISVVSRFFLALAGFQQAVLELERCSQYKPSLRRQTGPMIRSNMKPILLRTK
jgi:hypothetical protein